MQSLTKVKKIILAAFILALVSCIHPSKQVYEAKITGVVLDEAMNPIAGARVNRISKKQAPGYGNVVKLEEYISQYAITNADGRFLLPEKSRTVWFHALPIFGLPWVHCYASLYVEANDYIAYKSEFGDKDLTLRGNDNGACNGVSFNKKVRLTTQSRGLL